MAGDVADRYAVGRFMTDADGRRWFVLEGPSALTAAGAQDAYAAKLRERLNPPLQLSSDALFALHGVRAREREEELRRFQFETCQDPTCTDCFA
jgi:hypothetical protein